MNEQGFLSTLDHCCFWSSSQSQLCLIRSHSSPLSTLTPFPVAIYTSWQVGGLNLHNSIQVVTGRKDRLHQKPNFCSSSLRAHCHIVGSTEPFDCLFSDIVFKWGILKCFHIKKTQLYVHKTKIAPFHWLLFRSPSDIIFVWVQHYSTVCKQKCGQSNKLSESSSFSKII